MPLELLLLESDDDFAEMVPALWEAFENPFTAYLRIVCYLKNNSPEERVKSIEAATAQTIALHRENPSSKWIKVVHDGKLIGASNWILYKENPFTSPEQPIVALWWPEGDGRDYASHYLRQVEAPKRRYYTRPHVYLNISFTVPEWRRHGAGNLMMEWGVRAADEMGVDSFVEATDHGKFLYEKWGFMQFDTLSVNMKVENPSEEWERLEKEVPAPPQLPVMWRPIGGIFEPGKTTLPWETKPFVPITTT